ncbi:hypothetical protein PILCRDRAFT_17057 [Piloderma croceum F 1598]|uniref:Uncharacterized protein n=1 Tax=Piloderma croceum (strain F 1598) TaxID=765440 RepID=A0A0C3ACF3_PILCF|nr:hypothetical protein PILCRDRAFT_17057 [Piloderma croceum F 1598]
MAHSTCLDANPSPARRLAQRGVVLARIYGRLETFKQANEMYCMHASKPASLIAPTHAPTDSIRGSFDDVS